MATNARNNQGTGFTNYNDILNANQTSGQREGQAVAGGLQSQADAVNQNLSGQQSQFNTDLGTAQNQWDNVSALGDQLAKNATAGNNSAVGATTDASGNPIDYSAAGNNLRSYTYNGPNGLKDANGLQAQAQSAASQGQLAGTSQGQQQLLGQYVGGHGYTQGQSSFDQALLDKYGGSDINQAKKSLVGLGDQANSAITGAANQAGTQNSLVNSQKQDIQNKLITALGTGTDGTGILGQGATAKNALSTQVSNLQALLDPHTPDSTRQDIMNNQGGQDLLNNAGTLLGQWGVGTDVGGDLSKEKYFTNYNDQNSLNASANGLTDILGGLKSQGIGNYLLDDTDKAAANNLNSFIGNAPISADSYADKSKIFGGNLNDILNKTGGVTDQATALQNKVATDDANTKYWANELNAYNDVNRPYADEPANTRVAGGNDPNQKAVVDFINDMFNNTNGSGVAARYASETGQSLNKNTDDFRAIQQQLQSQANNDALGASSDSQQYRASTNQSLMDYLNSYIQNQGNITATAAPTGAPTAHGRPLPSGV